MFQINETNRTRNWLSLDDRTTSNGNNILANGKNILLFFPREPSAGKHPSEPRLGENAKVVQSLSFSLPSSIFQLHFIYHNLLTLIYRYTASRHICMRHRNLHWPSLNVTVLLNDRPDRPRTVFRTGLLLLLPLLPLPSPSHDGNSWNFHAYARQLAPEPLVCGVRSVPVERYNGGDTRYRKIGGFCNGNRFHVA